MEEIIQLYDQLIKKYSNLIDTNLIIFKKIYKLQHSPIVIMNNNEDDYVYLSERLIKFFYNTDYYLDEKMELKKLVSKINYITDESYFENIKNTDDTIYKDLFKIVGRNYITKKILITRFIKKYTNTHKIINIVI
jgi:PHD/YefM family antitoxin component YafN of YafNO toxin-antitoxin module